MQVASHQASSQVVSLLGQVSSHYKQVTSPKNRDESKSLTRVPISAKHANAENVIDAIVCVQVWTVC